VGRIASLAPGIYKYQPSGHQLHAIRTGDLRRDISAAALGQDWLRQAPVLIIVAAEFQRTTRKYGERGQRYVQIEAGHVAQNIYLQATALNLGATVVGAFRDERLKAVLGMPDREDPICIVPVGRPSGGHR
jgi:SagB-type dehydrogenase family enzyme